MGCLPESGGCERRKTDPFIKYLNEIEGASFSHEQCLDLVIRDRPQPEVLYKDAKSNQEIVIERKNFVWPLDYAEKHNADHILIDALTERLSVHTRNGPYALAIRSGFSIDSNVLKGFANKLADEVIPHIRKLKPGQSLMPSDKSKTYRFWLQESWERDDFEPANGLVIQMQQPKDTNDLYDPNDIPKKLQEKIKGSFDSCASKFKEYANCRKILLIDQYGELRYNDEEWWNEVFSYLTPPTEISEIWLGIHDWITDWEEGWMFWNLYTSNK